jgi:hypothetical protein
MTLIIQKPTTSKLILAKDYVGIDDPDAAVYIAAVEAADEIESPGVGALETATKVAIHSFVKGCKADGIWPAIKASCILAGARTLAGALVPLVGAAPTNFNFVAGDYNRETGLVGDGSTKYLNSNRAGNADPQDNCHLSVYVSQAATLASVLASNRNPAVSSGYRDISRATTVYFFRCSDNGSNTENVVTATGLLGVSRPLANSYLARINAANVSISQSSASPSADKITIFDRVNSPAPTDARVAFYSIGGSLNLALLDARVTDLINAFAAAIP